jgi:hypothetical protein
MKTISQLQRECGTYAVAKMMANRNVTLEHALIMLARRRVEN